MIETCNKVSPEEIDNVTENVQCNALRKVYGHLEKASDETFRPIRSTMLQNGPRRDSHFIGFGTSADILVARKLIAGINHPFAAKEKKKDAPTYSGQSQPISVMSMALQMLRDVPTNDGYTLGGLHAALFETVNVKKHTAGGDAIMLFDLMRLLGTFSIWVWEN